MGQVRKADRDCDCAVVGATRKLAGSRNDRHSEKAEGTGLQSDRWSEAITSR